MTVMMASAIKTPKATPTIAPVERRSEELEAGIEVAMAPPAEAARFNASEVAELPEVSDEGDDGAEVVGEEADDDPC